MSEQVVKECDYATKKLDCRKRRDVETVIVRVLVQRENTGLEQIADYKRDLCPVHDKILIRGIEKVMGDPAV